MGFFRLGLVWSPSLLGPSSFLERNTVITHKLLQNVYMNAVSNMKERAIFDSAFMTSAKNLNIHIEIKIQMTGGSLHAPNTTFNIKRRATALAPKAGCA